MSGSLVGAARRVAAPVLLGAFPLAVLAVTLVLAAQGDLAYDFHHELYPEARLVVHGESPYPAPDADLSGGRNNIWPVVAVLPVVPLTLLPPRAADWAATALVLLCLVGALWVLDIRDWRVYGASLLWPPVINGIQTANATLPLCLLCAVAWRLRGRSWLPGVAVGAAIATKPFLWPLGLWLLARGRIRAALAAVACVAASLGLMLPFIGIGDLLSLWRSLADTFSHSSYTLFALLSDAGAGSTPAWAATVAAGTVVLALAWRRRSLGLAVGAALILSPIVWLHFFALLVIPLALAHPRFHRTWLLALPLWLVPGTGNGTAAQTALALAVIGLILVACERVTVSMPTPAGALR